MVEKKKGLELKKHVATIHSSNKLTLLQRKIANALLFNAYDDLLTKVEHAIRISTLCKLIGYDSNDHKTIKKALINLLSTVIEWNLIDGSKSETDVIWNASSIIADASINEAICTYSYSNKMKNLLYQPELYGRLNMQVQAKFKSSYGLALYENCIRFQSIEQTPWFDILKFRKLMGIEDGKYKIFRDFKNRVLDKAIEEVNKYSPININPRYRKDGRQVISIQFVIKQAVEVSEVIKNHPKSNNLSEILKVQFGLSKKQLEDVLSNYESQYILEKISIIQSSSSYKLGKIANLAKYLLSALQEDYQPVKSSNVTQLFDNKITKFKKVEQNRIDEYHRYLNKKIIESFNLIPHEDQTNILSEFKKYLGKGIYHDIYLRDGLSNILIQDQLCAFIKQKNPEMVNSIPSYSQFCHSTELN